jgi:ligand-binding SRPBCC domain-containing protein
LNIVNETRLMTTVTAPDNANVYEKSTVMNTTLDKMVAFHEDPKALSVLTPPPIFMRVKEDNRTSMTAGDLKFTLWFAVVPLQWHVEHQAGPTEHSFADMMLSGPMAYWRHEHIFEPVEDRVKLTDRVTIAHKDGIAGLLTRLMFDGIPLRILFFYRHLRTKWAVEA